jgi:hypothetical protein
MILEGDAVYGDECVFRHVECLILIVRENR